MKTQTFNYVSVAIIALMNVLSSCDKKDDFVDVKLLNTETEGQYYLRKFIYDEQNRMKEIWTFSGGTLSEKVFLTYTGEDLTKFEAAYLIDGDLEVIETRNYVKVGNKISWSVGVEITEGEGQEPQDFISTITLNNDGFPEILEEKFYNITLVSTFRYVNGNLTKYSYDTKASSDSNDPGEQNYTYGTNRSAYSGCKTPKWFMFLNYHEMASHNAVTKTSYPPTATYSYVFDSDRFPLRCTRNFYGYGYTTEFEYMN